MKFILAIALSLSVTTVFAGQVYICQQNGENLTSPHKMILTQVGSEAIKEGKRYTFELQLFQGNNRLLSESVSVEVEDVMFQFSNRSKKIVGMIYMDELDQSWFKLKKTEIQFDCR